VQWVGLSRAPGKPLKAPVGYSKLLPNPTLWADAGNYGMAHLRDSRLESSSMDRSILVAIARFPDRGHAIEELARTNEDFRLLCADLADAEAAAIRWERSSAPVGVARSVEYRDLARDLAAELGAELDRRAP
jgi:hypothetical protein